MLLLITSKMAVIDNITRTLSNIFTARIDQPSFQYTPGQTLLTPPVPDMSFNTVQIDSVPTTTYLTPDIPQMEFTAGPDIEPLPTTTYLTPNIPQMEVTAGPTTGPLPTTTLLTPRPPQLDIDKPNIDFEEGLEKVKTRLSPYVDDLKSDKEIIRTKLEKVKTSVVEPVVGYVKSEADIVKDYVEANINKDKVMGDIKSGISEVGLLGEYIREDVRPVIDKVKKWSGEREIVFTKTPLIPGAQTGVSVYTPSVIKKDNYDMLKTVTGSDIVHGSDVKKAVGEKIGGIIDYHVDKSREIDEKIKAKDLKETGFYTKLPIVPSLPLGNMYVPSGIIGKDNVDIYRAATGSDIITGTQIDERISGERKEIEDTMERVSLDIIDNSEAGKRAKLVDEKWMRSGDIVNNQFVGDPGNYAIYTAEVEKANEGIETFANSDDFREKLANKTGDESWKLMKLDFEDKFIPKTPRDFRQAGVISAVAVSSIPVAIAAASMTTIPAGVVTAWKATEVVGGAAEIFFGGRKALDPTLPQAQRVMGVGEVALGVFGVGDVGLRKYKAASSFFRNAPSQIYRPSTPKAATRTHSARLYVIDEKAGKVLLTKDKNSGNWSSPGGFTDPGVERSLVGAFREFGEELYKMPKDIKTSKDIKKFLDTKDIKMDDAKFIESLGTYDELHKNYLLPVDNYKKYKFTPGSDVQDYKWVDIDDFNKRFKGYTGGTRKNPAGEKLYARDKNPIRSDEILSLVRYEKVMEVNKEIAKLSDVDRKLKLGKATKWARTKFGTNEYKHLMETPELQDTLIKDYLLDTTKGISPQTRSYVRPAEQIIMGTKQTPEGPVQVNRWLQKRSKTGQFVKFQKDTPIGISRGSRYDVPQDETFEYANPIYGDQTLIHASPGDLKYEKVNGVDFLAVKPDLAKRGKTDKSYIYFQPGENPGGRGYLGVSYLETQPKKFKISLWNPKPQITIQSSKIKKRVGYEEGLSKKATRSHKRELEAVKKEGGRSSVKMSDGESFYLAGREIKVRRTRPATDKEQAMFTESQTAAQPQMPDILSPIKKIDKQMEKIPGGLKSLHENKRGSAGFGQDLDFVSLHKTKDGVDIANVKDLTRVKKLLDTKKKKKLDKFDSLSSSYVEPIGAFSPRAIPIIPYDRPEFETKSDSIIETVYAGKKNDIDIEVRPKDTSYTPKDSSYIPKDSSYIPRPQDYTPRPQDYTPKDSSYIPRPQDYTPRPQDYTPRPQDYTPRPQDYTPRPQGYSPRPPGTAPISSILANPKRKQRQRVPSLADPLKKKKKLKKKGRQKGYEPFVLRKGVWVQVGGTTTKAKAMKRGETEVLRTPSATFKVRESLRTIAATKKKPQQYTPSKKFRAHKIKKGKIIPLKDTFIQKKRGGSGRIASAGEKLGITSKGIAKRKEKSLAMW